MAWEIERKFLVAGNGWRSGKSARCHQGYLSSGTRSTVRVRRLGERGFLCVKGPTEGATRMEYEYEIPVADADEMLDTLCEMGTVDKIRYEVEVDGRTWEVDEFLGQNEGLVVAEIELDAADQDFTKPAWLGREVTGDARYYNACLARTPWRHWANSSSQA